MEVVEPRKASRLRSRCGRRADDCRRAPSPLCTASRNIGDADEDPPPLHAVRCVPLRWCRPAPPPRLLWDDAGTGGKRGALWVVNNMGLVGVGKGADPPKDPYYDLKEDRFFLTAEDVLVLRDEAPQLSAHGSSHGAEGAIPEGE